MLGLLGNIFSWFAGGGTPVDKTLKMIDNAFFTEQERAERRRQVVTDYLEHQRLILQNDTHYRSVTRRYIALAFVVAYVVVLVLVLISPVIGNEALYSQAMGELTPIVILIITFYFGTGAIKTFQNGGKKK